MSWKEHQKWEEKWWDGAVNTYWEETKQLVYAEKMGLLPQLVNGKYPVYDLKGISVLDIGGGPTSILLKCINFGMKRNSRIVDPLPIPQWAKDRYEALRIEWYQERGEVIVIPRTDFDEVWIYNCLQHVDDPKMIIKNAKACGKIIRIFEWIDMPPEIGHPQTLTEKNLNKWLGGEGQVQQLNERGCVGKAYFGIFKGDNYETV